MTFLFVKLVLIMLATKGKITLMGVFNPVKYPESSHGSTMQTSHQIA